MLLKSLFCLRGRDSRPRFVAISVCVYTCISLAAAVFGPNFLMYLLALAGLPLLAFTSLRRLADAGKPKVLAGLLILPLPVYLALLIVGAPPFIAVLGLVLALGATFWGGNLASPTIVDYRFGYYGPAMDAPISQAMPRRRVEPMLTPKTDTAATVLASTNPFEADVSHDSPNTSSTLQASRGNVHSEPIITPKLPEIDLDVLRQDELRFDALTRMTQNPADFVVQDVIIDKKSDFRPANSSRVDQANIELADVDVARVDLQHTNFKAAPVDPADHSNEPVWRFDPEDEHEGFNSIEYAEEVRRRRAEDKESGSMTELFRGLLEFISPYRRYLVLPKIPMPDRRYWRPMGIGFGAILLVVLVWGLWPSGDDELDGDTQVVNNNGAAALASERIMLNLPDGFSVALEADVLILRWLGEKGAPQNIWSLATAKGDKTCSALVFNNGTEYRPVTVDLKADSATEARFSPLDTGGIIVDLARRGNIGLCGYKFSLKGSQAVLEQNRIFGDYLAR
ncbi:hypothetical protein L2744_20955 [Shewanella profunda]|uniref:hypothetical protein n=1 Tax=Shewanella profunda TaxID=254793 RepID=UPI00200F0DF5|nr:hypothetical protein [Shewanella profunda]MCL1092023.1 hypothetical protein [Shewanella profunda]